jgi:hypothetical protein
MYLDSNPNSEFGHINSDKFKVNPNLNKKIFVVEDFYEDPNAVREFALQQWYHDDSGFLGLRTRKQFFFEGVKEKFEDILGMKITDWETMEMNGRFQSNKAGIPGVYHTDDQEWAAAVYLTPNAPFEAGTSFYAHKESKVRDSRGEDWYKAFNQKTFTDSTPYQLVDTVGNVFNRLVMWDAQMIHAAPTYFGWDIDSSRLFQIFFFNTEKK